MEDVLQIGQTPVLEERHNAFTVLISLDILQSNRPSEMMLMRRIRFLL